MLLRLLCVLFFVLPGDLKRIEDICVNDTDCEDVPDQTTIADEADYLENTTAEVTESTEVSRSTISDLESSTASPKILQHTLGNLSTHVKRIHADTCECNLNSFSCDVNCCCDQDCTDFQLTAFSSCEEHPPELFDSRYCYNRDFLERNNTPFILEKLAKNLFCILYDNLPPAYTVNTELVIETEKDWEKEFGKTKQKWEWKTAPRQPEFNGSSVYLDGDIVWKLQSGIVEPIELLQSGFTGLCSFWKKLGYLRDWRDTCLQVNLTESNEFLFPETFSNFTVIRSPNLVNQSSLQVCPKNVCLPIKIYHCSIPWANCSLWNDVRSTYPGSCSNGTCRNIVLGVKYLFLHNGTAGIEGIRIYFNLGNVSTSFYQKFESNFQWLDLKEENSLKLSGNPGYTFGKPIFIGDLVVNKTQEKLERKYVIFNRTQSYLSLPKAKRDGECDLDNRHRVLFAEDVKSKCSVSLPTRNFSSSVCAELQERAMSFLLQLPLSGINETLEYNLFLSKSGNFTDNSTDTWTRLLLDRIPENVVTGQVRGNKLHCSGLISSLHMGIFHASLKKPETLKSHQILGAGLRFAEEIDVSWKKCRAENCTDVLRLDLINFVTFQDASKPSKYYFVGAPNLDITLPYDFFYPFLATSCANAFVGFNLQILALIFVVNLIYF